MKAKVYTLKGEELKSIDLPKQFEEPLHTDLIKRAVLEIQSGKRQPYGVSPEAGQRASAKVSRRRRNYRGAYGKGISRVPRKVMWRRGTNLAFVGAFAPGTVGGRKAHPPKAEKIWIKKMNKKERRKAIRSAISATINPSLVKENHKLPERYPLVIEDSFENLKKTREVKQALLNLG
jgi:large subunit ribosomal protein L4e